MISKVIVVDDDIDIFDEKEVLFALATRMTPSRDISIIENSAGNHLDPAAFDETGLKTRFHARSLNYRCYKATNFTHFRKNHSTRRLMEKNKT
jgi:3-polyprenyl-4-hydroxybenzoate decarboxylase